MVSLSRNSNKKGSHNEAIFRSAPMALVQFYVTIELARDMVFKLGILGHVHFRDLNSRLTQFQRTFINELRSIDSIEQKLDFLSEKIVKYVPLVENPSGTEQFKGISLASTSEMDTIKSEVSDYHERVQHLDQSYTSMLSQKQHLIENRLVIHTLNDFHNSTLLTADETPSTHDNDEESDALLADRNGSLELGLEANDLNDSGFESISGTISRDRVPLLRKILWRTLRGNLYFHDIPIDNDEYDNDIKILVNEEKSIFIIYIHGDFLRLRVRKIIQSLDGVIYDNLDGGSAVREETHRELNDRITDVNNVLSGTRNHLVTELQTIQKTFFEISYVIQRERLIYETLNKFDEDSTRRCLVGEGWIPRSELENSRHHLKLLIGSKNNRQIHTSDTEVSISFSNDTSSNHESAEEQGQSLFAIEDHDSDQEDEIENQADSDEYNSLIAVVNELSTNRTPPTFHKTNKFTAAFQSIIDAYGIATYQEVNPGLATIITFPFMFAIMFGDLGHGFIVLLIGLYLVKNETRFGTMRNKDEIFEMAFNGRYIVLLMGLFSMYTGLIYNDVFSKSMSIFKSGWKWEFPKGYDAANPTTVVATKVSDHTYFFGLDWMWHGAENNLLFTNSYKMKLSILMGYIHMNYSLMFSLVNYRFFKSKVDIIGNFIPGFLFMQSIFGYLALTILYKWSVDWLGENKQPPGLLNMLINMFLSPGKIDDQLYPGQGFVQIVLVLIALVCVPWLLLYKPMVLKRKNNKAIELGFQDLNSQTVHEIQLREEEEAIDSESPTVRDSDDFDLDDGFHFPNDVEPLHHNSTAHGDEHGGFNFGDIVIHQVIHTIEFCLNCVSHTASYLRLWALSLAHAQLSTVLWSMTISNAFGTYGSFGVFMTVVLFGLWFVLTVCILVLMEGTSAMLHSLRLHWVEAMSKFFEGEGYAYEPFAFDSIDLKI